MTMSTTRDDAHLVTMVREIPGVACLYSAHPTIVTVASGVVARAGRAQLVGGPLAITDSSVKVRIGIDQTRSTAEVGAAVYDAIRQYFRTAVPHLDPTIEIEIATIR